MSRLVHQYLDGLGGIEIGAGAHNSFGLPGSIYVDRPGDRSEHEQEQLRSCGRVQAVDVEAYGDKLPFPDGSLDYVLTSHVLEHFYDPIGALREWRRVVRPGGFIVMIVPHKERTFDWERPRTTLDELRQRNKKAAAPERLEDKHHNVWVTEDVVQLCANLGLRVVHVDDVDDQVGNGFTVVVQV